MDKAHSQDRRSDRVSTLRVPVADPTDRPTSATFPDGIPRVVDVGQVSEVTQHVTLPGIVTVTRSKALRLSARVIAWHAFAVASGGPLARLLDAGLEVLWPAG